MVRPIVDQMAPLAQALEIAQPVIARVMIEVRRRQDDAGSPHLRRLLEVGPPGWPATAIAPSASRGIEPTSIRQTANGDAMRPTAPLANAGSALEAHAPADL
jgi:hypothetical protein